VSQVGFEAVATKSQATSSARSQPWAASALPPHLIESKLQMPEARGGIVVRSGLLDRIEAAGPVPVIAVVAPAGYGKSTFLAQWAHRRARSAWVSCDSGDNDPAVLLTCLAAALAQIGAVDPALFRTPSPGAGIAAVPSLMDAIDPGGPAVSVALDHVEAITNRECHYVLTEFALRLPRGWQIAMASRHVLALPVARLRVEGQILEVGVHDLAMGTQEAQSLLNGTGATLAGVGVADLVERTEGWPIGLYLAGRGHADSARAARRLSSADVSRHVLDYLQEELVDGTSPTEMAFLTRTSVLERMSGPLCDAVVGGAGSGRVLEQLEKRNLLVIPLDRRREWYRYHHLFRELLDAELRRREPEIIGPLHSRAAAWLEANSHAEEAIEHAQSAGEPDRVARLVLDQMQPVWASGRVETVLRWMTWFEQDNTLARHPAVAAHGALIFALLGRPVEAERWAAVAQQAAPAGLLPDGSTMRSVLAYLRAILARDGVDAMRRDARVSLAELAPRSPYRATMLHTEGISYLLDGDPDRAEPLLAEAADLAEQVGALPLSALVLAERCIVAADRHDWPGVTGLVDRAVAIVEDGRVQNYWTTALVYAWAARAALHRGDLAAARKWAAHTARLRPLLNYSIPVVPVQTLLELARVYLGLGDSGGADAALRQAEDILGERPRLGVLPAQAEQLRASLDLIIEDAVGASALTAAELRLVPLLGTHLTLTQIGERLNLTRSTVKTQTTSIYQKLRVSSRREAVSRSWELGLDLDRAPRVGTLSPGTGRR
jgi:LuxR family maltose regulon positive regulatory protein